jgi:hypothetical protein
MHNTAATKAARAHLETLELAGGEDSSEGADGEFMTGWIIGGGTYFDDFFSESFRRESILRRW